MKIMVCYDSSDTGKEALNVAIDYAKAFSASIHVVTSFPQKIETDLTDLSQREKIQQRLLETKEHVSKEGIDCSVAVVTDDVTDGENLVNYADDNGMDAVVIGVRRASKVGKLLFGSTAQHVILTAHCPVISVKVRA
jgi:nucleotide-binding universal stress UspA family protein